MFGERIHGRVLWLSIGVFEESHSDAGAGVGVRQREEPTGVQYSVDSRSAFRDLETGPMSEPENKTLRMDPRHGWRARPGCKIFVADRGAVRFDYPQDWIVTFDEDSVKLHDREPPDDECCLGVSYLRVPAIDWSGLPLRTLLQGSCRGDERSIGTFGPVTETRRVDLEVAWHEMSFVDPAQKREARSRVAMARRSNLQCLITFDFWAADLAERGAAWDIVLETLELGELIGDPSKGPVVS
jgi:hypothetical protein